MLMLFYRLIKISFHDIDFIDNFFIHRIILLIDQSIYMISLFVDMMT
jgi:hypothetical protein